VTSAQRSPRQPANYCGNTHLPTDAVYWQQSIADINYSTVDRYIHVCSVTVERHRVVSEHAAAYNTHSMTVTSQHGHKDYI